MTPSARSICRTRWCVSSSPSLARTHRRWRRRHCAARSPGTASSGPSRTGPTRRGGRRGPGRGPRVRRRGRASRCHRRAASRRPRGAPPPLGGVSFQPTLLEDSLDPWLAVEAEPERRESVIRFPDGAVRRRGPLGRRPTGPGYEAPGVRRDGPRSRRRDRVGDRRAVLPTRHQVPVRHLDRAALRRLTAASTRRFRPWSGTRTDWLVVQAQQAERSVGESRTGV